MIFGAAPWRDAGKRVEKAHVVVIEVDFPAEAVGETFYLQFASFAVFQIVSQLVREPQLAWPEAGGPACVAGLRVPMTGAPDRVDAVFRRAGGVVLSESVKVAVDRF